MPTIPIVEIENLRFGYGAAPLLALDHFAVARAEAVLIRGPSGCGKTTLLHLIAGLLRADAGTLRVAGQALAELKHGALDRFRGRHIGMVLQQFHLLPSLTVLQNVLVAQSAAGFGSNETRALAVLRELGVAELAAARPHRLSVGQQQRVAIARALVNDPPLVLADEPTSSLDDEASAIVLDLMQDAADRHGAALVIATHDQRVRQRIARELVLTRLEQVLA